MKTQTYKTIRAALVLASAAIVVFALTGCGTKAKAGSEQPATTAETQAKRPEKVRVAYYNMPYLTLVVKDKKFLEDALGVPVEWKEFDGGAQVEQALAAGEVDFAVGIGSSPVAAGIAQGIEQRIIWIAEDIGDNEALAVKPEIKSVADLKGKKVAVPFVSTSHYALLGALKSEGVDPASVQILDFVPKDIPAAFERGDIDGAWVWHPALGQVVKLGGTIITSNGEVSKKGYVTWDNGVVTEDFASKYPDAVTEFVKAQQKALDLFKSDPDSVTSIIAEATGATAQETRQALDAFVFPSAEDQLTDAWLGTKQSPGKLNEQLKAVAAFLVEQKKITSAPEDFSKNIDPSFIADAVGK